jgi:hypothetical protein
VGAAASGNDGSVLWLGSRSGLAALVRVSRMALAKTEPQALPMLRESGHAFDIPEGPSFASAAAIVV